MKNLYILFLFSLFASSFAQATADYAAIDSQMALIPVNSSVNTTAIANYIDSHFKNETDKVRASFYWTASSISYDVANMFAIDFSTSTQEKIEGTLKSKKGVCIHYAEVFNDINSKMGIQSYVIDGYTKKEGKVGDLAHAWNAVQIDNKWYVFDPTWGSGYVNKGKFFKKLNNSYFKVDPVKMIVSHIPFDYLWQFLNYPVTNAEFYAGKTQINKVKKYFDFENEIAKYVSLSETDQLFEAAERIQKNGLKNGMIAERYQGKKEQLGNLRNNISIEKLNAIVSEMNEAVVLLNDFIYYRNNKFKPSFPDAEISRMIQLPKEKLKKCLDDIYKVGSVVEENEAQVAAMKKNISNAAAQAEEHLEFVESYLSKSKLVRKTMFSKSSWFGIPLN